MEDIEVEMDCDDVPYYNVMDELTPIIGRECPAPH